MRITIKLDPEEQFGGSREADGFMYHLIETARDFGRRYPNTIVTIEDSNENEVWTSE